MADSTAAPPISVAQLLGGLIVEICIACILYGITTAQAYVYMLNCKKDPIWLKTLVAVVWVLETAHSAFMIRQMYYYTIIGFGDFDTISKIDWSVALVLFMEDLIAACVQGFFIRRIWVFSNKMILLTFGLIVLLVVRISFALAAAIFTLTSHTWLEFQERTGPNFSVVVTNGLSAGVDGIIAISMIVLLYRSQTGIKRTDGVIRWLMAYTVNTGAMVVVVMIVIAITYSTLQGSLVFAGWVIIISKLYANAFLGTLNARDLMRQKTIATASNNLGSTGFELPQFKNTTIATGVNPRVDILTTASDILTSNNTQTMLEDTKSTGLTHKPSDLGSVGVSVTIEEEH